MTDDFLGVVLVTLGAVFLASLGADALGQRTRLPRVTLLLLLGVGIGPLGLDVLPVRSSELFPFVADLALVMVAFLLGGELTFGFLRSHGRAVLSISIVVVLVTAAIVAAGLYALGWPMPIALLLGGIATSTDPTAVSDVVREARARGDCTRTLVGVVAVDDAWGILTISVALALVLSLASPDRASAALLSGLYDLGGGLAVGCALGFPIAFLSGRVRPGEPTQTEALGGVLLCGGVALLLEVSFLLAAMTMGVVVANAARHHRRSFRAIEGIEWPFMVLFFVLSGASLRLTDLGAAAPLTAAYIGLRVLGRLIGGWAGAKGSGRRERAMSEIGISMLPQAGVAIGMALVVSRQVPESAAAILSATVAGTIVFEVVGPPLTRLWLDRAAEDGAAG